MIYHVAKSGDDYNVGSKEKPFLTIQRAADVAAAGDRVIVHEGVYREWVKPVNGGISVDKRIVYEAAEGEKVVIKGSEVVKGWEVVEEFRTADVVAGLDKPGQDTTKKEGKVSVQEGERCGKVWRAVVPNTLFGKFNPFALPVGGDWLVEPRENPVHLGEVYLNGEALYEARNKSELFCPKMRSKTIMKDWWGVKEFYPQPEKTVYLWYAEVQRENTVIYANFQEADPNAECVEINVRKCCFFPEVTGLNYITVRGFEMAQAATAWAPPTAEQVGIIGPNWSKGWIIENNIFHDAKCSAVSLGKEKTTGDNEFTKWRRKPGYQNQMEAVFLAKHIGWSKERIGSHIVRNNVMYNCGQNGVVGHLGCIFSEIYGNEIYGIAVKREYYGHEIAGIKLHAAIDVQIHHNYIHDCLLGTWLDWQAQGTRVSCNIFDKNARDFMIEVTHGPCTVDNNIFASAYNFDNAAQGTAFVHNLCMGHFNHYDVLDRSTPYHLPHSTDLLGTTLVYGNDDRWYQNIFVGGTVEKWKYGLADYNGAPVSLEEYIERVKALGEGDVERFVQVRQPVYINGNVYLQGAEAFDREEVNYVAEQVEGDAEAGEITKGDCGCKVQFAGIQDTFRLEVCEEGVFLHINLPEEMFAFDTQVIDSDFLGLTRLTEARFENPDGSDIILDYDMTGAKRGNRPMPGPVEGLKPGENVVCIWKR